MELWNWLLAFLLAYAALVRTLWQKRCYVRSVLVALSLPIGGAGALVLFWTLFAFVFEFLVLHWLDIALIVGVPICFFSWLASRKKTTKPVALPTLPDALVLEQAKQGLMALAEIVYAVFQDMAEYMPIARPSSLSGLYCPNKSHCIEVKAGVAIVSMMVQLKGEINDKQFMEMFNLRLSQRLDARDLPNLPDAVFYDAKNNPHTSIQAIGCLPCGGYLKLDIVRVNEAAVALLDSIALAKTGNDHTPPAPPASPYF